MKTDIIPIGNSSGIRIPKAILKQYGFTKKVDLIVDNGKIIITPIAKDVRKGWSQAAEATVNNGEDEVLDSTIAYHLMDDKDWQW